MPYAAAQSLTLDRTSDRLIVRSPFWSVTHDLDHGGAPADIRFVHGLPCNILREPISTSMNESRTALRVRNLPDGFELRFANAVYRYTPYWIRREAPGALCVSLDDRFTHWGAAHNPQTKPGRAEKILGPHYDQDDGVVPAKPGPFFRDTRVPGWMNVFRPGGEGISVAPTGDLSAWGDGEYRLTRVRRGVTMHWGPTPGRLRASFITLPNLPALRPAPLRTVMVGNPPFPDDAILRAWAKSGVELIVIMEGASWVESTDRYWRVGDYPCYHDPYDMRALDRLIRSAHRFGMRIIPYTCPTYLHPEAPIFHRRAREWYQMPVPSGQIIYHPAGKSPGGCYGALMCPDSPGWREYYLRHVRTLLAKHDFDGLYLDNVWKAPCHHPAHGSACHGGLDGLWRMVGEARSLLGPDRLMVIHNGEFHFQAISNNLADMIVTLEGIPLRKDFRYDLASIVAAVRGFPACGVSIVPRSTWYRIPPPLPKRLGLHDGIAKALLLGTIPYSYAMWETRWGYKDHRECLRDARGIYAAFRKLQSLRLGTFCLVDARVSPGGIRGVCYRGDRRQVVLVANISGRAQRNIRWSYGKHAGNIPLLDADEYRFVEIGE